MSIGLISKTFDWGTFAGSSLSYEQCEKDTNAGLLCRQLLHYLHPGFDLFNSLFDEVRGIVDSVKPRFNQGPIAFRALCLEIGHFVKEASLVVTVTENSFDNGPSLKKAGDSAHLPSGDTPQKNLRRNPLYALVLPAVGGKDSVTGSSRSSSSGQMKTLDDTKAGVHDPFAIRVAIVLPH